MSKTLLAIPTLACSIKTMQNSTLLKYIPISDLFYKTKLNNYDKRAVISSYALSRSVKAYPDRKDSKEKKRDSKFQYRQEIGKRNK